MDNIWQKPGHAENVLELWRAIESWINNTTVTLLLFGILIAYIIWLFVAGKIETGVRDDIRHGLHQVLHLRSLADRPEKNRHPARRRLILGEPRGPLRYRPNEMEHEERF